MIDLDARGLVEELAHEMKHRADAGRAVRKLARARLGVGDEIADRVDRQRAVHHQAGDRLDRGGNRREIAQRIVGEIPDKMHRGDVGARRGHQERIAVGRGACHEA
jgi:hypothetical protein